MRGLSRASAAFLAAAAGYSQASFPAAAGALPVSDTPVATADGIVQQMHSLDNGQARLKLVQVVFRHGARTPLSNRQDLMQKAGARWDVCGCAYPAVPLDVRQSDGAEPVPNRYNTDQISKALPGGCHVGQLTETGQLQARAFGEWLRSRYVDQLAFLPPNFHDGLMAARSTYFQRTLGTLAGVLTGLLNGSAADNPIPVTVSGDLDEILYADSKQCPHLGTFLKLSKQVSQDLVRSDPDYAWAREQLKVVLSVDDEWFAGTWTFADVADVMWALEAANKPLPSGYTPELHAVVSRLAVKEFGPYVAPSVTDNHGQAVLRLSMGRLLSMMVANMEAASAGPHMPRSCASLSDVAKPSSCEAAAASSGSMAAVQPRMHLFSGHDSTIMPLLSALGEDTLSHWPPFLSNIVFELWEVTQDVQVSNASAPRSDQPVHVVRVLYNREELCLPACPAGMYFSLDAFKQQVVGPFLASAQEVHNECHVGIRHDKALPVPQAQDVQQQALTSASAVSLKGKVSNERSRL